MIKKLKCVVVDDDPFMHEVIQDLCKGSEYVELIARFICPKEFLDSLPSLEFDLCLLDIMMTPMDGLSVAKRLNGKHVIFITSASDMIPDAVDLAPLDLIRKPIHKERFEKAMRKACYIAVGEQAGFNHEEKKKYELFKVAEVSGKVKINMAEVVHVKTHIKDHRNKQIRLLNGKQYTLMDYSLEEIKASAPHLVQVNISELVSPEIIHDIEGNVVTLKGITNTMGHPVELMLGRAYKKSFLTHFHLV